MTQLAQVGDVHVDDEGIHARTDAEVVLDVLFDGRRIWSFWLQRDGERRRGEYVVPWPGALRRFLNGTTQLRLVEHVNERVVYDAQVGLGEGDQPIAVVNEQGRPLGLDKSNRLTQTFDTRSAEHVEPLLDAIEEVLGALRLAGVDPFLAYGTLLGAVRGGKLIGHDSDADLGYVSERTRPVDVVRESFALQRALADMGYRITRYSGAAFKVDVAEADGSLRGLDVFGGFLAEGNLHLMGEIRTPFRREWIFPLGTTSLEGRTLPAPVDTDRFLTATYGPTWRVPDPAYHFATPESTHRRLNGWFRGTRVKRENWDRTYSGPGLAMPDLTRSGFARWVRRQEDGFPATVVDIGCGRAVDALWFARNGSRVIGLDYVLRGSDAVAELAAREGVPLERRHLNLCELRSVLANAARIAALPGEKVLVARHIAEATDRVGRGHLWRACEMMLRGDPAGGRLYLEFLAGRGTGDGFARSNHLHTLRVSQVEQEIAARGGRIVSRRVRQDGGVLDGVARANRICRMVVEWQR
ncbi:MAG TPA: class I SAM-dependent methyltransferase [Nocardioidaceae bacterium]|nr:class I SAM-dependent methyltransferase [Nocardioidaceae bacterium]